ALPSEQSPLQGEHLVRSVGELLTNAHRHGSAGPVHLAIRAGEGPTGQSAMNITFAAPRTPPAAADPSAHGGPCPSTVDAGPGRGPAARGEDPAMSEPPTPPGRVRILLADDEPLVRQGMRLILDAEDDLEVIGEAGDGAEALALARRDAPDLVCMDVRMPDIDGIRATELVLRLSEPPKVLVETTFEHDGYVLAALLAGASGFLLKRSGAQEMVQAVRTIAHGDSLLFPDAVRTLLRPRARSKGYTGPAL